MTERTQSRGVPPWVPILSPILGALMRAGVPMGLNALVTIPGRKSGQPRTTPLTVIDAAGSRWVIAPFGEVNWVRNLRAGGRATVRVGRRREEVTAVELEPAERAAFFRDVLRPRVRRTRIGSWIVRNVDRIDLDHPDQAAEGRPVFELRPVG